MKTFVSTLIVLMLACVTPALAQSHMDVAPLPLSQHVQETQADVVVYAFTSKFCEQCQRDKPTLEKLRKEGHNIVEIDVDAQPDVADRYGITELPTYVVEHNGREVERTHKAGLLGTLLIALLIFIFS